MKPQHEPTMSVEDTLKFKLVIYSKQAAYTFLECR